MRTTPPLPCVSPDVCADVLILEGRGLSIARNAHWIRPRRRTRCEQVWLKMRIEMKLPADVAKEIITAAQARSDRKKTAAATANAGGAAGHAGRAGRAGAADENQDTIVFLGTQRVWVAVEEMSNTFNPDVLHQFLMLQSQLSAEIDAVLGVAAKYSQDVKDGYVS